MLTHTVDMYYMKSVISVSPKGIPYFGPVKKDENYTFGKFTHTVDMHYIKSVISLSPKSIPCFGPVKKDEN